MKISKIVSATLFGAVLATGAFAAAEGTIKKEKQDLVDLLDRAKKISTALDNLEDLVKKSYDKFTNYSDSATDETTEAIKKNLGDIVTAIQNISQNSENFNSKITKDGDASKYAELKIDSGTLKINITQDFEGVTADVTDKTIKADASSEADLKAVFATDNKAAILKLLAKVKTDVADEAKNNTLSARKDLRDATIKALKGEANGADNKIEDIFDEFLDVGTSDDKPDVFAAAYDADIKDARTAADSAYNSILVEAKDGKPAVVKSDKRILAELTELEKLQGKYPTGDTAEDKAKKLEILKDALKNGLKFKKSDGNTDATIENIAEADFTSGETALKEILSTNNTKKLYTLKEAIEAKSIYQELLSEFNVLSDDYSTKLANAQKNLADELKKEAKDESQIKNLREKLEKAQNDLVRVNTVRIDNLLKFKDLASKTVAKDEATILAGLADISASNKVAKEIFNDIDDADDFIALAKATEKSAKDLTTATTNAVSTDIIKFNSELSTNIRLAKLANPYNADLALAKAVSNLKADSFADNGSSVSSVIKDYSTRVNQDNNIWANLVGAKAHVKNSLNPTIFGLTLGYDKALDNTIVGGFFTYAKSKAHNQTLRTQGDNYQFGVYARTYLDNSEIDAKLSYGFVNNKLDRTASVNTQTFKQNAKFKSNFFELDLNYGYVVGLSDSLFAKPLLGLNYSSITNNGFAENGDLPFRYSKAQNRALAVKLGTEFRKYASDGNYIYFTPALGIDAYKKSKNIFAGFVGSNKDILLSNKTKKGAFVNLQTGVNVKLTDNLSTNVNFGAKLKKDEKYYNGTVGVRYAF